MSCFSFLQHTTCFRKRQVIWGERGCAHALHPSPRSAPVKLSVRGHFVELIEVDPALDFKRGILTRGQFAMGQSSCLKFKVWSTYLYWCFLLRFSKVCVEMCRDWRIHNNHNNVWKRKGRYSVLWHAQHAAVFVSMDNARLESDLALNLFYWFTLCHFSRKNLGNNVSSQGHIAKVLIQYRWALRNNV